MGNSHWTSRRVSLKSDPRLFLALHTYVPLSPRVTLYSVKLVSPVPLCSSVPFGAVHVTLGVGLPSTSHTSSESWRSTTSTFSLMCVTLAGSGKVKAIPDQNNGDARSARDGFWDIVRWELYQVASVCEWPFLIPTIIKGVHFHIAHDLKRKSEKHQDDSKPYTAHQDARSLSRIPGNSSRCSCTCRGWHVTRPPVLDWCR